MALGGASAGVGAVCEAVADRLAANPGLLTSIWLERGGRLRCVAGMGGRPGRVGVSPTAGAVGAAFTAGAETMVAAGSEASVAVVAGSEASVAVAAGSEAPVAEVCLPIRSEGCVIGVLEAQLTGPVRAADLDTVRRAADEIGDAIAALGGPPAESSAQRMLRHLTSLSALEDAHAIAGAVLAAAIDLIGLESAALVPAAPGDRDAASIGPLGAVLAALPPAILGSLGADATAGDGPTAVVVHPADHGHPAEHAARHGGADPAERAAEGRAKADPPTDHAPRRPDPAELAPLRAAGIGTLVAVGLVAQGQPRGVLLVAGRADGSVPPEDLELLELLAAHAATCLRTADLVRSLRERAATDPLTGLGHHATFHEALAHTHRRPRTAVVLVDVDGFKRLNDTFGHQHGDQVLRAIAAALSGALRRGDTLFRIGGDEFAALLAVAGAAEALDAGMRLRAAVAEARLGVTVSIGVAVPREGEPDAALLDRADRALYRVKAAGRDGVEVSDGDAATAPLADGPPA